MSIHEYAFMCANQYSSTEHNSLNLILSAYLLTYHNIVHSRHSAQFCYLNNSVRQHYVTLLPGGQPAQPLFKVCIFPWAQPLDKFSVVISPLVKANSLLELFHFHRSESLWFLSPSAALESGILLSLEEDLSLSTPALYSISPTLKEKMPEWIILHVLQQQISVPSWCWLHLPVNT